MLQRVGQYLFHKSREDYQESLNFIQCVPKIFNSILLYCDGEKDIISNQELIFIIDQIIRTPSKSDKKVLEEKDYLESYYIPSAYMRIHRHSEDMAYIIPRVIKIFKLVKEINKEMSFEKVMDISLEKIALLLVIFYNRESNEESGNNFFSELIKTMGFTSIERERFIEIINNGFLIKLDDLNNEVVELKKYCRNEEVFTNEQYTIFESKPLLELNGNLFPMSPHYLLNSIADHLAKSYIDFYKLKSGEGDSNKASEILGKAFENYIVGLLGNQLEGYVPEPSYPRNKGNKGIDLVRLGKNKIPFFLEISKAVTHQTLEKDYSEEKYKIFCLKKIVPKFKQIFKWMKETVLKQGDFENELKRAQLVVCLMKYPPTLYLDRNFKILMEVLNKEWRDITKLEYSLKDENVYVLSSEEFELAIGFARKIGIPLELILFEFKKYTKRTTSNSYYTSEGLEMRDTFKNWLYENYGNKLSHPTEAIPPELRKEFDDIASSLDLE